MEWIKDAFERDGYVIIPNILDQTEINEYIAEFNKWKNSIENFEELHKRIHYHGIIKYFEVGHQRFAWLARTNSKILEIFKLLWNTDELVTSFDGCCYYPKNYIDNPSYWIHSDQSSLKKGLHCIQSFVALTSNKERTMIVYEGSHKLHEEYSQLYNINNPSDWFPIEENYINQIEDKRKILEIDAGSLVVWDSRTFHQNTCGTPTCNEERLVQYLCYLPKNNEQNSEETRKKRLEYFNNIHTTNHWPYPITTISKQPITYNYYNNDNLYIDYKQLPLPILDDLYDKIYKLI